MLTSILSEFISTFLTLCKNSGIKTCLKNQSMSSNFESDMFNISRLSLCSMSTKSSKYFMSFSPHLRTNSFVRCGTWSNTSDSYSHTACIRSWLNEIAKKVGFDQFFFDVIAMIAWRSLTAKLSTYL